MANKPKRFEQIHITVPVEDLEKWRAFKEQKYNGLNAMSMMIRNFVNEGIEREIALADKLFPKSKRE